MITVRAINAASEQKKPIISNKETTSFFYLLSTSLSSTLNLTLIAKPGNFLETFKPIQNLKP